LGWPAQSGRWAASGLSLHLTYALPRWKAPSMECPHMAHVTIPRRANGQGEAACGPRALRPDRSTTSRLRRSCARFHSRLGMIGSWVGSGDHTHSPLGWTR
jgi:hypothetical protein